MYSCTYEEIVLKEPPMILKLIIRCMSQLLFEMKEQKQSADFSRILKYNLNETR